jgi:hypothetical protein
MKRAVLISGLALLALGACGKKTDTAATGTATATTASTPAPSTPPTRKAGLWTQTVTTGQMKQAVKMCLDATTEQKMKWWGSNAPGKSTNCEQESITPHLGGGWDFHSVCKMGESGTVTSDGTARGDFGSHYMVEVNSVTAGSPMAQANGTHKITIEANWDGPCPAGMTGGDMEVNGYKINMTGGPGGKPGGITLPNGGHVSSADMAKYREQAKAMAAAMKDQQK